MKSPNSVTEFVAKLRENLNQQPYLADRITAEVEDHLVQSVRTLEAQGLSQEDAVHEAIARFGTPEEIAKTFDTELRSAPTISGHFLVTLLRQVVFNVVACYAAVNFLNLVEQMPRILMMGSGISRIEFQFALPTFISHRPFSGLDASRLQQLRFPIDPSVILLCILLSVSGLNRFRNWLNMFLTYLIVNASVHLILMFLPLVGWGGGYYTERLCTAFPWLGSLMPFLRPGLGFLGGGLLVFLNVTALRSVVHQDRGDWMASFLGFATWIVPVVFITTMIGTDFFHGWSIIAEVLLTITSLLIMTCAVPALLLSHSRDVS